jgi:quercetin dioxygenase-like cupin family protein
MEKAYANGRICLGFGCFFRIWHERSPRFSDLSFFVVHFSPGHEPKKRHHPYEETFIILDAEIEVIVDEQTERIGGEKIAIIPANTWHEFKNRSDKPLLIVNLHPVPKMITEWV